MMYQIKNQTLIEDLWSQREFIFEGWGMVQKSVTKRLRITRRGKIIRRAMALGHS